MEFKQSLSYITANKVVVSLLRTNKYGKKTKWANNEISEVQLLQSLVTEILNFQALWKLSMFVSSGHWILFSFRL